MIGNRQEAIGSREEVIYMVKLFMRKVRKNIFITGPPGIGKTTLIKRLFEELKDYRPVGFYTEEIREGGVRKGFSLITLDGERGLLSHVGIKSPYRVGRYGVDVKSFEDFLDPISFADPERKLIVIDEIGKMECFSQKFRNLLKDILDSEKVLIVTVALKGGGFIDEVKKRDDVKLFTMTQGNRDALVSEILKESKPLLSVA